MNALRYLLFEAMHVTRVERPAIKENCLLYSQTLPEVDKNYLRIKGFQGGSAHLADSDAGGGDDPPSGVNIIALRLRFSRILTTMVVHNHPSSVV